MSNRCKSVITQRPVRQEASRHTLTHSHTQSALSAGGLQQLNTKPAGEDLSALSFPLCVCVCVCEGMLCP